MKKIFSSALLFGISFLTAKAQTDSTTTKKTMGINLVGKAPIGTPYWGNAIDGMIFSTALIDNNGTKSLCTLRFTMFLHLGATYNYNFNKSVGVYTGLDLKNIGLIEKYDAFHATTKSRVYTLGIPVGLRFGNMITRDYFMIGGGLDLAIQYKRKHWNDNQPKIKYNEWFSDETELLMPYVFAGVSLKGTTIKVQYYPTNFFNEDFTAYTNLGVMYKPYVGKNANLLLISLGRDIKFSRKK